jgi:hypothetical protein
MKSPRSGRGHQASRVLALALLLIPYLLYLVFIVAADRGPVDYETFMEIGRRFSAGLNPYGPNSYYPLPFVMLFGFLSSLARPLSMAIWFGAPLLAILAASGWQPWALLFAPVFGHFVGGQTDLFAVLGLWGFRRDVRRLGGVWLAFTLLKPQLALVPVGYALVTWIATFRARKTLPPAAAQFLLATAILYLPAFVIMPDWPVHWLASPRPFFERAMSGVVPRALLLTGILPTSLAFWAILAVAGIGLLLLIRRSASRLSLDLCVLWSFVVSPLAHDYDLVQLVPVLEAPRLRVAAILSSIPGWAVILFAYAIDQAWMVFAVIAPVLLAVHLRSIKSQAPVPAAEVNAAPS